MMKFIKIISFLAIVTLLYSCQKETAKKQDFTTTKPNQVEVLDFYGTHRCVACKAMEANAKFTVNTYFKNNPKVHFKIINVDDDKNEKIAERFEAMGTALYLNVIKNGKETHIDLTDFGFKQAQNKDVFTQQLKTKIETALKNL